MATLNLELSLRIRARVSFGKKKKILRDHCASSLTIQLEKIPTIDSRGWIVTDVYDKHSNIMFCHVRVLLPGESDPIEHSDINFESIRYYNGSNISDVYVHLPVDFFESFREALERYWAGKLAAITQKQAK